MNRLRLYFLLIAAVAAQTQNREVTYRDEAPTFRSSVNMVRVPVVVRDHAGHPVGGLHKEDFRLTDRGKPQEIAQLALEGSSVAKPAEPSAIAAVPGVPSISAEVTAPTRFVAYVFDDVHLTAGELGNVVTALLKHVERGIPPQERVALLTLSGTLSLELTNDVGKFRETLAKIKPVAQRTHFPPASFYASAQFIRSPGDESLGCTFTPPCSVTCDPRMPMVLQTQTSVTADCLQLNCEQYPTAPPIARATLRAVYNEGAAQARGVFYILNNIVRLLGSMPGDRLMILVSPGIYLPDELQPSLSESIDRATRSGVIINTLDGRGVYSIDPATEVQGCSLTSPRTQQDLSRLDHEAVTSQGLLLGNLAYSTGGASVSDNDFLGGFDRLATPPEYVYFLGFYPNDLKPDGKFHELKVTLANGQGLSVQARKGYWAPAHAEDPATAASREISEAIFSHEEMSDLPLDLDTGFYKTTAVDAKLKITAHLDIHHLRLRKVDDLNRDDLTVVCALFDGNGNYLQGLQKVLELRVKDENLAHRRSLGLTLQSNFDVKPGAYMIRVVARDAEGLQMASANATVEVR